MRGIECDGSGLLHFVVQICATSSQELASNPGKGACLAQAPAALVHRHLHTGGGKRKGVARGREWDGARGWRASAREVTELPSNF